MIGVIIITSLALIFGIIITILESKLDDSTEEKTYLSLLPGYNCGACGFGSCSGMAKKMCEDINNYKKCKPLKGEKLEELENYIKKNKD